jgi:hypothetical protein
MDSHEHRFGGFDAALVRCVAVGARVRLSMPAPAGQTASGRTGQRCLRHRAAVVRRRARRCSRSPNADSVRTARVHRRPHRGGIGGSAKPPMTCSTAASSSMSRVVPASACVSCSRASAAKSGFRLPSAAVWPGAPAARGPAAPSRAAGPPGWCVRLPFRGGRVHDRPNFDGGTSGLPPGPGAAEVRAAISMARCSLSTSTIQTPARYSLASGKGPSVMTGASTPSLITIFAACGPASELFGGDELTGLGQLLPDLRHVPPTGLDILRRPSLVWCVGFIQRMIHHDQIFHGECSF